MTATTTVRSAVDHNIQRLVADLTLPTDTMLCSLLDQLDSCLYNSTGPLDLTALGIAVTIDRELKVWARQYGSPMVADDPQQTLERWARVYLSIVRDEGSNAHHAACLTSWAARIRALVAPPASFGLTAGCPACGEVTWWNPSDGREYPRPLCVETSETSTLARCRACDTAWAIDDLSRQLALAPY